MNKLIGITGGMSSGKTTLSKEILKLNNGYIYIDVDEFRRNLFYKEDYINKLKNIKPLRNYKNIDSNILNKYIYTNDNYMQIYKDILYKYLFNYINSLDNKIILIDWALIINDNLIDKFDKIIYLNVSEQIRYKRLINSDLTKEEIKTRFKLQEINNKQLNSPNIMIVNNDDIDIIKINNFINSMECKFSLPNGESKAIWEITHSCNYGCSYCIFSCKKEKVEGELTTKECFHVIDQLVQYKFKHLKITGGEPFIRNDLVEILEYASKFMIVDVSTNASFLNENIINRLNKIDLKMIHISLDGNKEEHELVRGDNTYNRTIKGLEYLKNSENKTRIGTVIHKGNENNLEKLVVNVINNLNANEIIFSIMEPVNGQSNILVKTKTNDELVNIIEYLKEKYESKISINYNFASQPNYIKKCPAGDKFLYINNKGFVSPCTWVYENNKDCISKISLRNNNLSDVLEDSNIIKFTKHKKEGICYGKI